MVRFGVAQPSAAGNDVSNAIFGTIYPGSRVFILGNDSDSFRQNTAKERDQRLGAAAHEVKRHSEAERIGVCIHF